MPLEVSPQQGHGPGGIRVTEILRAVAQKIEEQVPLRLAEESRPPGAVAILQVGGIVVLGVGGQPMVDGSRGHPQVGRDGADGLTRGDFEDGQGAAVYSGFARGAQLLFEATPLPVGQGQAAHRPSSLPYRLPILAPL